MSRDSDSDSDDLDLDAVLQNSTDRTKKAQELSTRGKTSKTSKPSKTKERKDNDSSINDFITSEASSLGKYIQIGKLDGLKRQIQLINQAINDRNPYKSVRSDHNADKQEEIRLHNIKVDKARKKHLKKILNKVANKENHGKKSYSALGLALKFCAREESVEVCRYLILQGASVDNDTAQYFQDNKMNTPANERTRNRQSIGSITLECGDSELAMYNTNRPYIIALLKMSTELGNDVVPTDNQLGACLKKAKYKGADALKKEQNAAKSSFRDRSEAKRRKEQTRRQSVIQEGVLFKYKNMPTAISSKIHPGNFVQFIKNGQAQHAFKACKLQYFDTNSPHLNKSMLGHACHEYDKASSNKSASNLKLKLQIALIVKILLKYGGYPKSGNIDLSDQIKLILKTQSVGKYKSLSLNYVIQELEDIENDDYTQLQASLTQQQIEEYSNADGILRLICSDDFANNTEIKLSLRLLDLLDEGKELSEKSLQIFLKATGIAPDARANILKYLNNIVQNPNQTTIAPRMVHIVKSYNKGHNNFSSSLIGAEEAKNSKLFRTSRKRRSSSTDSDVTRTSLKSHERPLLTKAGIRVPKGKNHEYNYDKPTINPELTPQELDDTWIALRVILNKLNKNPTQGANQKKIKEIESLLPRVEQLVRQAKERESGSSTPPDRSAFIVRKDSKTGDLIVDPVKENEGADVSSSSASSDKVVPPPKLRPILEIINQFRDRSNAQLREIYNSDNSLDGLSPKDLQDLILELKGRNPLPTPSTSSSKDPQKLYQDDVNAAVAGLNSRLTSWTPNQGQATTRSGSDEVKDQLLYARTTTKAKKKKRSQDRSGTRADILKLNNLQITAKRFGVDLSNIGNSNYIYGDCIRQLLPQYSVDVLDDMVSNIERAFSSDSTTDSKSQANNEIVRIKIALVEARIRDVKAEKLKRPATVSSTSGPQEQDWRRKLSVMMSPESIAATTIDPVPPTPDHGINTGTEGLSQIEEDRIYSSSLLALRTQADSKKTEEKEAEKTTLASKILGILTQYSNTSGDHFKSDQKKNTPESGDVYDTYMRYLRERNKAVSTGNISSNANHQEREELTTAILGSSKWSRTFVGAAYDRQPGDTLSSYFVNNIPSIGQPSTSTSASDEFMRGYISILKNNQYNDLQQLQYFQKHGIALIDNQWKENMIKLFQHACNVFSDRLLDTECYKLLNKIWFDLGDSSQGVSASPGRVVDTSFSYASPSSSDEELEESQGLFDKKNSRLLGTRTFSPTLTTTSGSVFVNNSSSARIASSEKDLAGLGGVDSGHTSTSTPSPYSPRTPSSADRQNASKIFTTGLIKDVSEGLLTTRDLEQQLVDKNSELETLKRLLADSQEEAAGYKELWEERGIEIDKLLETNTKQSNFVAQIRAEKIELQEQLTKPPSRSPSPDSGTGVGNPQRTSGKSFVI